MRNKENAVSKYWFTPERDLHTTDYDKVFSYRGIFEFGITVDNTTLTLDILGENKWKRTPTRREHLGTFMLSKRKRNDYVVWESVQASLSKKMQGKGIAATVYTTLAKSGYCIMSGSTMSEGATKLWSKLSERKDVDVLNYSRGKWYQVVDIDPKEVYGEERFFLFA